MQAHTFLIALMLLSTGHCVSTLPANASDQITETGGSPPVTVSINSQDNAYCEGDQLAIRLQSQIDAYVYCIYHQADGRAVLLFPNVAQRGNRITAGTDLRLPSGECDVRYLIGGPFGHETLQVLASSEPLGELERLLDSAGDVTPVATTDVVEAWCEEFVANGALIQEDRIEFETRATEAPLFEIRAPR